MADKKMERIEDIPNVIKVKDAPKPTEAELRDKLVNEMRDRQKNRKITPPKHSGVTYSRNE